MNAHSAAPLTLDAPSASFPGPRAQSALLRIVASLPWAALVPVLLFLPVVLAPPLNHDVAAILDFAQRWLAGERLYVDLIDVNPPLIFVLTLVPAAIARVTGIPPALLLRLCVLGVGLVAGVLAWRVRDRAREGVVERPLLDALPVLVLLGAGVDFGQREHLMAILALPYLLAAGRRAAGARVRGWLPIALFAALGFALKPHFLAVPLVVEALVLIARRRTPRLAAFDKIPWTMAVVWAIYLASLPLLFPAYLTRIVPLAVTLYPAIGDRSIASLLTEPRLVLAMIVVFAAVAFIVRQRPGAPVAAWTVRAFAAASIGAIASAVAQQKGWSYHIHPIEIFGGAALVLLAAQTLDTRGLTRRPRAAAAALVALPLLYGAAVGKAPWRELDYASGPVSHLAALIGSVARPGDPVLVLSPAVYPVYPAITYAGVRTTLPAMDMWMLQGAYARCLPSGARYRDPADMGAAETFLLRSVADGIANAPPTAIVVDRQPGIPWCGSEFDFLDYFGRDPVFRAAWSHYHLVGEWDGYRVFAHRG